VPKRPETLLGKTPRFKSKCGWLYVTVDVNEKNELVEVFFRLGKQGSCARAWLQNQGEIITDWLSTSKVDRIWKHYYGINCVGNIEGLSCQNIIANVLEPFCNKEYVREIKERVGKQKENEQKAALEVGGDY
jgi:hypothetical protein